MADGDTDVVGSKLKAENGYGQNGFPGPSSDTDLKNPTRSPLAVELFGAVPDVATLTNDQMRTVSDKMYPAKQAGARTEEKIPEFNKHILPKGAAKHKPLYKTAF